MAEFEDLTKTIKAEDRKEFSDRLRAAKKASYGDSNDLEIDTLWELASQACYVLDVYSEDEWEEEDRT
jgi:hypothetical protein